MTETQDISEDIKLFKTLHVFTKTRLKEKSYKECSNFVSDSIHATIYVCRCINASQNRAGKIILSQKLMKVWISYCSTSH